MTMKISWGKRIAILYLGFVAIIVTLVVGSMREDFDLVSKDYYAQEIAYQNVIDAGKNQAALSAPVQVGMEGEMVVLTFPAEFKDKSFSARLHFYSPVSAALDKQVDRKVEQGIVTIARNELQATNYQLKITWECDGKQYFQESEINTAGK